MKQSNYGIVFFNVLSAGIFCAYGIKTPDAATSGVLFCVRYGTIASLCLKTLYHLQKGFAIYKNFEFPHFFEKLNHLQNKKAKTLH